MNNKKLIILWLVITIAIVGYRAYRRNSSARSMELSSRDQRFAVEACNEGFRCLGYSCVPGHDNDAEAERAAIAYCRDQGEYAIVAASLGAVGMVVHYTGHHKLPEHTTAALMQRTNELIATQFSLTDERLHDARMNLMKADKSAQLIVETVARHGFQSCRLAREGELSEALRKISARAGSSPI